MKANNVQMNFTTLEKQEKKISDIKSFTASK